MAKEKILVVDDEPLIRWTLNEALRSWGYETLEAGTVAGALSSFEADRPVAVLLDINLPDGSGLDVLRELKARQPNAVVIMITANVLVEDTIAAMRGGAYDFIGKPINLNELQVTIRNGLEASKLRREVSRMRREQKSEFNFEQIIGQSPTMQRMLALARRVAESEASSVLLQGESGTGKDLVAKATHFASHRTDYPFVAINCAAIPATLLESELFGYEKGAFTDAKGRKEGLFEQAEGGTIFLDEIGELELGLQAKLLRVLEEGAFRRVGGLKDLPLHVRVIAASNRDLRTESEAGRFRLDLYYRLSVIQIDLPPLRERGDDVLALADFYLKQFNQKLRKQMRGLAPEVAEMFRRYPWPGNVRELRNVIERVMILEDQDYITANWLPRGLAEEYALSVQAQPLAVAATVAAATVAAAPPAVDVATNASPTTGHAWAATMAPALAIPLATPALAVSPALPLEPPPPPATLADRFPLPAAGVELEAVEMSLVEQALKRSGGNQTRAAELLHISRDQLRYRLKKLESGAAQPEAGALAAG